MNPILSISKQKEDLLRIALLEIENKYPSNEDIAKFGGIQRQENLPNEEIVTWKGKPILWTKYFILTGKVEFKFLYQ